MTYTRVKARESEDPTSNRKAHSAPTLSPPISEANDASEREVDRIAHEVMSGGTIRRHWSLGSARLAVQRKCECGSGSAAGQCEACSQKKDEQKVQRKAAGPAEPAVAPPIVHDVLNSPGQPLDHATRNFFEPRFGHDFSKVCVHTDSMAQLSAQAVNARAYTVREHLVFGSPKSASSALSGRDLVAHELAHTIQQGAQPSYAGLQRQVDEEATDRNEEQGEAQDGDTPVVVSAAPDTGEQDMDSARGSSNLAVLAQDSPEQMQAGAKPDQRKTKQPAPPPKITSIDVDLSTQRMTVHYSDGTTEGRAIASGRGSPGTSDDPCKTQTEEHCTPTGDFKIASKGNKDTANTHGDKMAWYVEPGGDKVIDGRGIGIHNSQPVGGGPRSHGCVRVGNSAADEAFAKKINKVVDGKTVVHITGKAATKPWGTKPAKKKAQARKAKP